MAIVSSMTIVAGFFNTYGPKVVTGEPALPAIIHVHAGVFTSWLVLFVLQTTLVLTGRTALHRRLGVAGMVLAALMFVVGMATAITVARMGHRGIPGVEFPDAEGFLLLNVNATLVFAILVAAGWYFRRNVQTHKRLMLTAVTGALVGPGASRLPGVGGNEALIGVVVVAFLLAGPVHDLLTRRRVHRAYLWSVPLAFLAVPPVVIQLASTPVWRAITSVLLG
jgi:hypothetical protein